MALAMVVWCALGVQSAQAQCRYEVTTFVEMLPCEPIGPVHVRFYGLNEFGQACGSRGKCTIQIDHNSPLPIVWTPELGLVTLPLPQGATGGVANDINNLLGSDGFGQVACTLNFEAPIFAVRAALYDDGEWTILDPEGTGTHTEAFAINDDGWIAGYRDHGAERRAMRWRGSEFAEIVSSFNNGAIARDISEASVAVGGFGSLVSDGVGFIWEDRSIEVIPILPIANSGEARAINRIGQVAGGARIPVKSGSVPYRSWRFLNGVITDLGMLPNTFRAITEDINDGEQIVGHCQHPLGALRPFLWQSGEIIDLRDLYDSPFPNMTQAMAINNRGQIAGIANERGIILTPIVPLGDVNLDCTIDGDDLALVLANWGLDRRGDIADIVTSATLQPPGDGKVDGADLAVVIGNWTNSPSSIPTRR